MWRGSDIGRHSTSAEKLPGFFSLSPAAPAASAAATRLAETRTRGGLVLIGHEHPALSISDGGATRAKCPCFLAGPGLVVLPAFSKWAAGTDHRAHPFMSPLARLASFDRAAAILAGKLLPMPFAPHSLRG